MLRCLVMHNKGSLTHFVDCRTAYMFHCIVPWQGVSQIHSKVTVPSIKMVKAKPSTLSWLTTDSEL
jgi:hypothetical protein